MGIGLSPVRVIAGASSAAVLLLGAGGARAESEPEGTRFHLAYEAPGTCPDRGAFLAAIRMRTTRPQLAGGDEAALTFTISIEPREGSTVGHLELREPGPGGAAPQRRTVSSGTCSEVAKALALVVALILDPDVETSADPQPLPDDEPAPSDEAAIVPAEAVAVRRPARERPLSRPPVQRRRPIELSAGAELGATGAIGPALAPGAEVFVDVAFTPAEHPARVVVFAPALRVGGGVAGTSSALPVGSHDYWRAGGTARVCPLRVALVRTALRLAPCAGFQVGAHHGSTEGVPNGTASTDVWLAPIAGASLEWALTSSVALELQGGAVFPLVRTRFFLAPDTTLFEVPAVSGAGSVAVRLRFW